ncbi:MAG: sulfatase-like hydrolase/transferase [Candidatus Latescibacterota bacterium]|nr:sulfatase-like hydrolase/transferase [Candidatus Latescibacterota bacterium]
MSARPHILYILSDEHRGQAMGHAGDPNVQTPWMDRLASEGVSFDRAYANCPICTPSRGTIFTGRHAHAGAVQGFFDVFKPTAPSIATELRKQGYRTAYFGKWHCGIVRNQVPPSVEEDDTGRFSGGSRNRTPEAHRAGFEDWFGFENLNQHFNSSIYEGDNIDPTPLEGYETDALTDRAIDYLRNYDSDEPLFLVLSVTPPHFPLIVPERWERFDLHGLEVRDNFIGGDDMRKHLATYYAMIENLDWNIGRLMETLGGVKGFEDVLTVYFSDHGDYMGSHGRFNTKEHCHEESVRIPAIFHRPGHIPARGVIDDGMFSLVDLLATTLGLIDEPVPRWSQGTDFAPAITGEGSFSAPEDVLLEMQGSPRWNLGMPDWRGLVNDRWKYAFLEDRTERMYDLQEDPFERVNLAASNPDQCVAMRRRLVEMLREARDPYWDVLIEDGVEPDGPTLDVNTGEPPTLFY